MDILNNTVITNDCIRASVDVTEKELSDFSVEKGDMLFQRSSETLEDVGRANVYMDDKKDNVAKEQNDEGEEKFS